MVIVLFFSREECLVCGGFEGRTRRAYDAQSEIMLRSMVVLIILVVLSVRLVILLRLRMSVSRCLVLCFIS